MIREVWKTASQPGRARSRAAVVATAAAVFCLTTGNLALPAIADTPDDSGLAWGSNEFGQLGDGTTNDSNVPVEADLPDGVTMLDLAAGDGHSLALLSDGRVLAWGSNEFGQLGNGTTNDSNVPVEVELPDEPRVSAVAADGMHSLARLDSGRLLAWGFNQHGQLGDGTTTDRNVPVEVELPEEVRISEIDAGLQHSLAIRSDGRVLTWGFNDQGQLGDGTRNDSSVPIETELPGRVTATDVDGGNSHSVAALWDRRVFAWGSNNSGQLGDGTHTDNNIPVETALPDSATVGGVEAGFEHSVAARSDGDALAWGTNSSGQLGDGTDTSSPSPVEVALPNGVEVTELSSGDLHSLALLDDGRVLAWGSNSFGQVGDGANEHSFVPVETLIPEGQRVGLISAGGVHSLAWATED